MSFNWRRVTTCFGVFPVTRIKKKINFFSIYKEIQSGAVAKSYMRKGFPIYEEMGKYFPIYNEAVSYISLCNCSILNFLIYGGNFDSLFYQCNIQICSVSGGEDILSLIPVMLTLMFYC
jgi:hypothetical protein